MIAGDDAAPEALLERARTARDAAYAPYSEFRVGAALEADDGRVYTGVNVENASSPVGVCAERVALGKAVADGARTFRRLAFSSSGDGPVTPCGMCRQALAEFGSGLEVWSAVRDGEPRRWSLDELLPHAFRRAPADRSGAEDEPAPGGRA